MKKCLKKLTQDNNVHYKHKETGMVRSGEKAKINQKKHYTKQTLGNANEDTTIREQIPMVCCR
jgi:hypothetical protein